MVPMRMVGIDLTEGKDSSVPKTNWEFHHCKHWEFFMRLLKDKLPCDVATTWTCSHWYQSDGLHALPAAGSTAWDLPLSRTRKPQ